MNTYFITASRDMIFTSKQTFLQNQASVISTSLTALDRLSSDGVYQVMTLLDIQDLAHIRVFAADGSVLYSEDNDSDLPDSEKTDADVATASGGYDVFRGRFEDGAFSSTFCTPIVIRSTISGTIFIHEYDVTQGGILLGLQNTVKNASIIIAVISILMILFLLRVVIGRINTINNAVSSVREGKYTYRVSISGNDELALLGDEFNNLTSRLQETEEIRRTFVADASHELKTPLASIRLLSDSIMQNDSMSPEMIREFVSDISEESERLAATTEKLLALTKLDNNVLSKREPIDFSDVTARTIRMLNPIAQSRGITISGDIETGCTICAAEDEAFQISVNLVENAIKYNHDGGKVHVSVKNYGDQMVFTVDDTGVGVPKDELGKIFDRFYRVDKARSREAGGSGLGLSIVRANVISLGGSIIAVNRDGGGMRFQARLPMYRGQADPSADK